MTRHRIARFALAIALLVSGLAAQSRSFAKPRDAAQALERCERDATLPEDQRERGVRDLGAFDGEAITSALLAVFHAAKTSGLRAAAASGLAERSRPELLATFRTLFEVADEYRVRNALAIAIGRTGAAGVDELAARLAKDPDATARRSLLSGLAGAGTKEAFAVLARLASEGKDADRLEALRDLAKAPAEAAITAAREKALAGPDLRMIAEGLRQLALATWPGTKDAALKLHERTKAKADLLVRTALLEAFSRTLDAETFGPFVNQLAGIDPELRANEGKTAREARANAAFVTWLAERGLLLPNALERSVVIRLLGPCEGDAITKALVPLLHAEEKEVAAATLAALAARKSPLATAPLRSFLLHGPEELRADALFALHSLLATTSEWSKELLVYSRSASAGVRTLALDLLAELGLAEALANAHDDLDHKSWQVRAAAFELCTRVRDLRSIPLLIARVDKESGRLKEDVLDALESLTTLRFADGTFWKRWWDENQKTFVLPAPRVKRPETGKRAAAPTTVTYYDLPVESTRAVFVLDTSGSMAARIGTGKDTRLEEAKRQLARALGAFPDKHRFNMIFFASGVTPYAKALVESDKKQKELALAAVQKLTPLGGTNIFDALERAYADPDVDTIYLLTDGAPSAGKIQDPVTIAAEIERWNRTRRLRIHCVSVGEDSKLLQRLAELTGGQYRYVR